MGRPSSLHEDFVRVKSLNDLERIQVEKSRVLGILEILDNE